MLGLFLIVAGINHFRDPQFYINIMPDYIPFQSEVILLSGWLEIALGIMVLFNKTKRLGAWLIIAMLLIYLLVHIDMVVHAHDKFRSFPIALLWIRLPIQFLFMFWAWWSTNE